MPKSGNVKGIARRKAGKAASKHRRRRNSDVSSSLDLSSDGGYSALDDVSDSDEDDEDEIVAAEEKHIIKEVVKTKHRHSLGRSPRPSGSSPVTAAAVAANSSNSGIQSEEEDADQEGDGNDDNGNAGAADDDDDDDDDSSSSDSDFDLGELDEATLIAIGINPPNDADVEDAANNHDDLNSWNGISESDANLNNNGKRQVRFAGVPDSDSDDSSSSDDEAANDSTFFPDIFVEQNQLDPAFRREIENESDSSVSSSFWDYHAVFEHSNLDGNDNLGTDQADDDFFAALLDQPLQQPPSTPQAEATDATNDGEGYDSDGDDGDDDTTEDEAPPMPTHGRRGTMRHIDSDDDDSSDSDSDSKMSVTPQKRRLPRVRRYFFTPRSRRPVAMINPASGKMVIFTPEKRAARTDRINDDSDNNLVFGNDATTSAEFDAQLNALLNGQEPLDLTNTNGVLQSSPLISSSGAVMMSAMISSQTFGDYIQSHNVGPIEAFFPANMTTDTFLGEDSDFSGEIIEDEGESNLRLEDFIQFDRNSADGTDPADVLFGLSEADPQGLTDDEFLVGLTNGLEAIGDGDDSAAQTPIANGNNFFFSGDTSAIDDMIFSSIFDSGGSGLDGLGDLSSNNNTPVSRRASLTAGGDDGFNNLLGFGLEGIEEEDESALEKDKDDGKKETAGADDSDNGSGSTLSHKRHRSISEVKDLAL